MAAPAGHEQLADLAESLDTRSARVTDSRAPSFAYNGNLSLVKKDGINEIPMQCNCGKNEVAQENRQVNWEGVMNVVQGWIRAQPWDAKPDKVIFGRDIPVPDDLFLGIDGVPCSVSDSLPADQIQIVTNKGPSCSFSLGTFPLVPEETLRLLNEYQEKLEESALKIMEQRYPGEQFTIVRRAGCFPEVRRVPEPD